MTKLWWLLVILKLGDVFTTAYVVSLESILLEANPLIKYFMYNIGVSLTLWLSLIISLICISIVYLANSRITMIILCCIMGLVVINNTYTMVGVW